MGIKCLTPKKNAQRKFYQFIHDIYYSVDSLEQKEGDYQLVFQKLNKKRLLKKLIIHLRSNKHKIILTSFHVLNQIQNHCTYQSLIISLIVYQHLAQLFMPSEQKQLNIPQIKSQFENNVKELISIYWTNQIFRWDWILKRLVMFLCKYTLQCIQVSQFIWGYVIQFYIKIVKSYLLTIQQLPDMAQLIKNIPSLNNLQLFTPSLHFLYIKSKKQSNYLILCKLMIGKFVEYQKFSQVLKIFINFYKENKWQIKGIALKEIESMLLEEKGKNDNLIMSQLINRILEQIQINVKEKKGIYVNNIVQLIIDLIDRKIIQVEIFVLFYWHRLLNLIFLYFQSNTYVSIFTYLFQKFIRLKQTQAKLSTISYCITDEIKKCFESKKQEKLNYIQLLVQMLLKLVKINKLFDEGSKITQQIFSLVHIFYYPLSVKYSYLKLSQIILQNVQQIHQSYIITFLKTSLKTIQNNQKQFIKLCKYALQFGYIIKELFKRKMNQITLAFIFIAKKYKWFGIIIMIEGIKAYDLIYNTSIVKKYLNLKQFQFLNLNLSKNNKDMSILAIRTLQNTIKQQTINQIMDLMLKISSIQRKNINKMIAYLQEQQGIELQNSIDKIIQIGRSNSIKMEISDVDYQFEEILNSLKIT